jgi:LysR family transcriptional activator of nhaA
VQVTCREGKIDDLLGQLAAHRLDALLADEPAPSSTQVKTFSHPIGSCGVSFCAAPALKLRGRFPGLLQGAPMLLPTQNTALRRELEKWFREVDVTPAIAGEFEDAAMAKILAADGIGVTVVPTAVLAEARSRYGFVCLGKAESCKLQLYLISAERRIEHPAVQLLVSEATHRKQFQGEGRSGKRKRSADSGANH